MNGVILCFFFPPPPKMLLLWPKRVQISFPPRKLYGRGSFTVLTGGTEPVFLPFRAFCTELVTGYYGSPGRKSGLLPPFPPTFLKWIPRSSTTGESPFSSNVVDPTIYPSCPQHFSPKEHFPFFFPAPESFPRKILVAYPLFFCRPLSTAIPIF